MRQGKPVWLWKKISAIQATFSMDLRSMFDRSAKRLLHAWMHLDVAFSNRPQDAQSIIRSLRERRIAVDGADAY